MRELAVQAADRAGSSGTGVKNGVVGFSAGWEPLLPPVRVRIEGRDIASIHPLDRVRLCRVVSRRERLDQVGRDWRDVYAVIEAETAWAARDGRGRNGAISYGLAQLEMPTARALGIENPNDPQEAALATAKLIKASVAWARSRGVELLDAAVSVHYNLSTAGRNAWDGKTLESLPYETQRHVSNFLQGRAHADRLGRQGELFERAFYRERQSRRVAAEELELARVDAVKQPPHIALRSPENLAVVRAAEDEARATVRLDSPAPTSLLHGAIAPSLKGLEVFVGQLAAALRAAAVSAAPAANSAVPTGALDSAGTATLVSAGPPDGKAQDRFRQNFPTFSSLPEISTLIQKQFGAVSAYAHSVVQLYGGMISNATGTRKDIEVAANRRAEASAQLLSVGRAEPIQVVRYRLADFQRPEPTVSNANAPVMTEETVATSDAPRQRL